MYVLGNADAIILEILHRILDEAAILFSFDLAGAYIVLSFSSGCIIKEQRSISESLKTASQNEVLLSLNAVHYINQWRSRNKLTIPVHYVKGNIIATLVQCVVKAWTAVKERESSRSWEIVVNRIFTTP